MNRSGIDPGLLPLRFLRPVLWRPLLPIMNAILRILPHSFGREIRMRRHIIPVRQGGTISAAVIEPLAPERPSPCLIFYHGGAFMLETAPHHVRLAEQFALKVPCAVIMPKYRLAPRHPFPEPAEDCYAAYEWAVANAAMLNIDPSRIAVGGDSAGGNLAASVCQMARDRHAPPPCFQMLLYPVTDRRMESESMRAHSHTPMWNSRLNRLMWKTYLPEHTARPIRYASPIEAPSLWGLPAAYVETAQLDPLHDEGQAYAQALLDSGVPAQYLEVKGAFHGFDLMRRSSVAKQCMVKRIAALRQVFFPAES